MTTFFRTDLGVWINADHIVYIEADYQGGSRIHTADSVEHGDIRTPDELMAFLASKGEIGGGA